MSVARVLGILLLVAGIVLVIVGLVESRSLVNGLSRVFSGHLTQHTMWYIFGGAASAVVGLVLTFGAFGRVRS
jgi:hypothetical protein